MTHCLWLIFCFLGIKNEVYILYDHLCFSFLFNTIWYHKYEIPLPEAGSLYRHSNWYFFSCRFKEDKRRQLQQWKLPKIKLCRWSNLCRRVWKNVFGAKNRYMSQRATGTAKSSSHIHIFCCKSIAVHSWYCQCHYYQDLAWHVQYVYVFRICNIRTCGPLGASVHRWLWIPIFLDYQFIQWL